MDAWVAGLAAEPDRPLDDADKAAEATPGGDEPAEWVKVATTMGTPNAVIIAGRLESYQIPVRVTQEAAGRSALAVNVGILGAAHVWVPAEYEDQALEILDQEWDEEE